MRWALGSSLRFGRLVIALAIGLVVFGIAQLRSAPVDVYPEFTPPSVEIQTEALGLSAAETEQLITVPLEQDLLNGVPWLDTIHSSSMPGLSRSEEHTSELQSPCNLVCRLLLEKKKKI